MQNFRSTIKKVALSALLLLSIGISTLTQANSLAPTSTSALTTQTLTDALQSPWALAQIPDTQELLITQKSGQLLKFNLNTKVTTEITGVADTMRLGQGGFLDVAISPDFKDTQYVYFTYSKAINKKQGATTLARAELREQQLINWQDLLITDSASDNGRHFGSRISFDDNDHVYFSVGDRGERDNAQNLQNHAGTIIRLHLDGRIPKDNPFVDNALALPEIYSYGHRNPQGLFYDSKRNILFSNEHGPRGGDEINIIEKGKNYGWPIASYGKEYWGPKKVGVDEKAGMQTPLLQFTPSIAPSSLIVYHGNYYPALSGSLLSGALVLQHINQLNFDEHDNLTDEIRHFQNQGRVRDLLELASGEIVYITDSGQLNIIQNAQ